ncbi:MAG TPA: hypothetical protein VGQ73_03595 [Gemmatimonadales bacterium]|jgi:hypothetical protein|nr:hypothetical protein [Gemmatimonadales bacterium]
MRRPRYFLNSILGVVIAAGACSNGPPTAPEPEMSALLATTSIPTILQCFPLPPARSSAVIGKDGGIITVGPHMLWIPPKALPKDVLITAATGSDSVNAIRFEPEGLKFERPVLLMMSFANCTWGLLRGLEIVYTDDQLKPKEVIASVMDNRTRTVSGAIYHFSQYAVAY